MKKVPIDSKLAGQRNERLILSMLRRYDKLSQSQLCRLAGIGSSTASTIVARLREKGFVIETPGTSADRGPKPTLIELNPGCCYLFGVEINPSYLFIGLFNFTEKMIDKIHISLGPDHSVQHVLDLLSVNIPGLLSRTQIDPQKVLGIGVTLSGSVSSQGWVSLSSPLGWKNIPLKENLESFFDFPVFVYNNRVRLLAEFALNPELKSRNVLYLNVANGVGSTVYLNGVLISGASERYGEIGHIVVEAGGPVCGCGNKGCLEAFISGPALASQIHKDFMAGGADCFANAFKEKSTLPLPEEVLSQWSMFIKQKNTYAMALCDFVVNHFSKIAAMLINCYDPDTVILAGYISEQLYDSFEQNIRDRMKKEVYDSSLRNIEIRPAGAGKDALVKGIVNAILQELTDV
ncbi:MAG: ROK family transcriptional regulator [Planctomycetales bacterium]|nr:ROK family transcriptional regulator [Planctomycetales bacterium]